MFDDLIVEFSFLLLLYILINLVGVDNGGFSTLELGLLFFLLGLRHETLFIFIQWVRRRIQKLIIKHFKSSFVSVTEPHSFGFLWSHRRRTIRFGYLLLLLLINGKQVMHTLILIRNLIVLNEFLEFFKLANLLDRCKLISGSKWSMRSFFVLTLCGRYRVPFVVSLVSVIVIGKAFVRGEML